MKRIVLTMVGGMAAVAVVAMIGAAWAWPMINEVETGATPEYPELTPQYYSADPDRIFEEAHQVVVDLDRWEIVGGEVSERRLEAERQTRVFGFVDDVTIRVEPVTEQITRVRLRSASRVGEADFGQNARNIREFLTEIDERLGTVRFEPDEDRDGPRATREAEPTDAQSEYQ